MTTTNPETPTATPTTVGVLGAGTMGIGIAIVMAGAGHDVIIRDLDAAAADAAVERMRAFFDRSVSLGKLSAEARDGALAGVRTTTNLEALAEAGVVVEAIYEDTELKARTFAELETVVGDDVLFHSNTSTLSVTEIAAGCARPERVVGTHYCNPAPLMKLVEVVKARQTSEEAHRRTVEFLEAMGKVTVTTQDVPGFIVNRFLIPFENDCIRALAAGMGTVESIDTAVTGALRYPMGPFTLLDIVGLEVHRTVSLSLYEQLRDPRFAPPPLVDQMIAAGHLGRKTGRGFYQYERPQLFGAA